MNCDNQSMNTAKQTTRFEDKAITVCVSGGELGEQFLEQK